MTKQEVRLQCWHITYAHVNTLLATDKRVDFAVDGKLCDPHTYARQIADNIEAAVLKRDVV